MKKIILVTGAAGFIGSKICSSLYKKDLRLLHVMIFQMVIRII